MKIGLKQIELISNCFKPQVAKESKHKGEGNGENNGYKFLSPLCIPLRPVIRGKIRLPKFGSWDIEIGDVRFNKIC